MRKLHFNHYVMSCMFLVLITLSVINKPRLPEIQFPEFTDPHLSDVDLFETTALPSDTQMVHASFIEQLPGNRQAIFWFGGTREGHRDVQIYRTIMKGDQILESPQPILSAPMLSSLSGRFIKKIGNPVVKYHEGKLYLWVVSVSVGGWATAKVDMLFSSDEGKTFSYGEKLNTSPFFNVSTLVRNPVVETKGGFILPAYFELNRLDPVIVELDNEMRMTRARTLIMGAIQPIIIPSVNGELAHVYARPIEQQSVQQGLWSPLTSQLTTNSLKDLPNDSADSAVVRLNGHVLLMAHNGGGGRGQLYLSASYDNGTTWQKLKTLEDDDSERFAYPAMIIGEDGLIHLTYTWKREHIQYARFSVESVLKEGI